MADINDEFSLGNFSIQETSMGTGNPELLEDLYEPETASIEPGQVEPIVTTVEQTTQKPEKFPKGKTVNAPDSTFENEQEEAQSTLSNFLESQDDDENEDIDDEKDATKNKPADKKVKTVSQTDEDNEEDDDDNEGSTSNEFTALSNDLFKLGIFTTDDENDEEPINTPEEFRDRFFAEKKKGAHEIIDNFLAQFGEDYKNAFQAIYVKGADPKEYFNAYNKIVNFAEMDLSEEANQVAIMQQTLKDQGFDADDVESEIERLKSYGDLESVSTKHHKVLVKKGAQELQNIEAKAEQELQQKSLVKNQYIKNVQEVLGEKMKTKDFDGIPLNPKLANDLQDFLLVDKWKTPSGETLSDFDKTILDLKRPENHAMKVKVGLLLKILETDPTLSTIQKTGITKKTDALFGEVVRQKSKTTTQTNNNNSKISNTGSWFK